MRNYYNSLFIEGALLEFVALEMSGETIPQNEKNRYENYIKENNALFKSHCESGTLGHINSIKNGDGIVDQCELLQAFLVCFDRNSFPSKWLKSFPKW